MCLRLSNKRHCLSLLSILGFLQSLLAVPITILSFIVLALSTLGVALSPFWCGLLLLAAGIAGLLVRPTRQACVIFFHVIFNALSICTCFLAAGITGLYGTAVHLSGYGEFLVMRREAGSNDTCIFDEDSMLYAEDFRNAFRPIDSLINSCDDLEEYWKYLVSIFSLAFIGMVVSILAIISNCVAPCVEERIEGSQVIKTDV